MLYCARQYLLKVNLSRKVECLRKLLGAVESSFSVLGIEEF